MMFIYGICSVLHVILTACNVDDDCKLHPDLCLDNSFSAEVHKTQKALKYTKTTSLA